MTLPKAVARALFVFDPGPFAGRVPAVSFLPNKSLWTLVMQVVRCPDRQRIARRESRSVDVSESEDGNYPSDERLRDELMDLETRTVKLLCAEAPSSLLQSPNALTPNRPPLFPLPCRALGSIS